MSLHILNFGGRDEIARYPNNRLPLWNPLERIEYSLLDRRYAARGRQLPKSLDSIAIVAIDPASVQELKQWPWPRHYHAQLVDRLKRAGARVICLDIGFNDYSNPQLDPKTGQMIALSRDDQLLIWSLKHAGNVILVSHLDPGDPDDAQNSTILNYAANEARKRALSIIATPIDELDVLTPDLAVNYVKSDSDGGARRYPLRFQTPPETEPLSGIAPLCAAMFEGLVKGDDLTRYHAILRSGEWPDTQGAWHAVPLKRGVFPGQDAANRTQVWTTPLHYFGPQGTFPTYSYTAVLDPKRWSDAKLKKHFAGRLVFVGATYHVLKDVFPAPDFRSGGQATLPGVEMHATMAAMLLDGTYLHTQSTQSSLWTLFGLTLLASVWTAFLCRQASRIAQRVQAWWAQARWASRHLPGRIYAPLWVGICAALGPLPIYAFWAGAKWAFSQYDLWIIALYPALGAALSSGATFLLLFVTESSGRRKILTQMSRSLRPM